MVTKLVQFKAGKERLFEQDVLHFASDRYGSAATRTWSVMVTHVDSGDWIDLYNVSRHSFMEASCTEWPESDAWSLTWDELTPNGWKHADLPRRRQLVARLELPHFNPWVASKAVRFDLVTFIQDPLLAWFANLHEMPEYELHVLTHEVLHAVSDWSHQQLVIDGVPPNEDRQVVETLNTFIEHIGGWPEIRRRYLTRTSSRP